MFFNLIVAFRSPLHRYHRNTSNSLMSPPTQIFREFLSQEDSRKSKILMRSS